jgi:alanine racemase
MEEEMPALMEALQLNKCLKIKSIFSHLVASEQPEADDFTNKQANLFRQMSATIENAIGYTSIKHLCNTLAIKRHPSLQFDMVRLGIGLYGIDTFGKPENVTTLKTTISQIKHVRKGESVGYGRKALLSRDSSIATVRIGYADGYSRALGNGKGFMYVNGQFVPVAGNICMDMTMLDVTDIPNVQEGDEVIVFGEKLPVQDLAAWSHTIPYEILTNVSQRVKRIYYEE